MAFIKAGQPLFSVNSVIIVADLVNALYAFQLDSNSNPIPSTQKHFMDMSDPVGMTDLNPVTGDLLITTEQGALSGHITLVRGLTHHTPTCSQHYHQQKRLQPGRDGRCQFFECTRQGW